MSGIPHVSLRRSLENQSFQPRTLRQDAGPVPDRWPAPAEPTTRRSRQGTYLQAMAFSAAAIRRAWPGKSAAVGRFQLPAPSRQVTGGANFGGGIDFWLAERRGVRIEIRDQLLEEYGTTHLVMARIGF